MTEEQWCPVSRATHILGDGWSLLILRELGCGPQRFNSLKEKICGISMDQLTRKLNSLCQNEIILRKEYAEAPPRVEYQLTDKGIALSFVIKKLVVWATENVWSPPTPTERVDVALNLRVMASMFGQGAGQIEFRIRKTSGIEIYFLKRSELGEVIVARWGESPDAVVELAERDWVKILTTPALKQTFNGKFFGQRKILDQVMPIFRGVTFHSSQRLDRMMSQTPIPTATL